MKSNTLYESKDIDVKVEFADGTTAGDIIEDVKDKVKQRTYTPKTYNPTYGYGGTSYTTGGGYTGTPYTTGQDKKKEDKVERPKSWWEEKKEKEASGVGNGLVEFPWERAGSGYNGIGGYGHGYEYGYFD